MTAAAAILAVGYPFAVVWIHDVITVARRYPEGFAEGTIIVLWALTLAAVWPAAVPVLYLSHRGEAARRRAYRSRVAQFHARDDILPRR